MRTIIDKGYVCPEVSVIAVDLDMRIAQTSGTMSSSNEDFEYENGNPIGWD